MNDVNYGTREQFNFYANGKCHIIYNQGEILDEEAWNEINSCGFIDVDSFKEYNKYQDCYDINLVVWIEM
jgi:hypothetical protein